MFVTVDDLTKEDWQFILHACLQRFNRLRAKEGEPGYKKKQTETDEERRIMRVLYKKAYG